MSTEMANAERPAFYTVREAARLLRVGQATLYRAIREGAFPAVRMRLGGNQGRYVIPAKAVERLLDDAAAAGNCVEEAIVQGFLELAERDAMALWWYNRARRPQLDLDQVDDGYLQAVRREYAARGRSLWVLDVTTDLGVCPLAAGSALIFMRLPKHAGSSLSRKAHAVGAPEKTPETI